MQGQRVGYRRVSSIGQNLERQLDGIPLDRIFEDKVSGKDTNRPALQELLLYVRQFDTVICHSMDRLARSLPDLMHLVKTLTDRKVRVEFLKENLTFTGDDSPMSNLLLAVLGAISQFERSLIRDRQRDGIALAKKKGVYKGRKKSLSSEQVQALKEKVARGEKKAVVAREFKISRETLYKYLKTEVA